MCHVSIRMKVLVGLIFMATLRFKIRIKMRLELMSGKASGSE